MSDFADGPQAWVGAWSEKRAQLTPDRVGLVDAATGERYTYAALDRRANRGSRLLRAAGVGGGDRFAVVSRNRPELVDLFFAAGKTGSVLAPLSHLLAPPELAALLDRVDPALLVVERPFLEKTRAALDDADGAAPTVLAIEATDDGGGDEVPDGTATYAAELPEDDSPVDTATLAPDDPHLLLHTGGSTGTPKEAVITHRGVVWNSLNTVASWGLRDDDVTPLTFPMFHTGGWNVVTVPVWHMGGTVVLAREFDAGGLLGTVEREGATVLVAVPAVLRALTEHDDWSGTDLSTLRIVKSGGGPCRQSVMDAWWSRGVDLSQGYGLTECGPNNFAMPDGWPHEKADTVGKPAMHVDARVVEDGEPVERGAVGELQLRSPHAAAGYLDSDESAATFGGGWVSTGDLASVDADGYYRIEGRKKEMFVSGGENVYPAEIESVLTDHARIDEVVVVPVPDEQWGQVGNAVVEGDDALTVGDIEAFCDGRLARYKVPKRLAFVDEMPTSGPEKIDRQAVRERFGGE
ncbi:class I adenylate-forming enzyme family protein [Haloarcula onubensis]|uniref:AMP-binding protein n=1 Tax=Haloarcula onubensis TaxID=2950539 RepID=A0ABU2FU24_9EURY|nr:AMP-binding protein [Halomicroarcula sp. S3CR25-11]MDS0284249.1 AMP-binding protein [Halomicroarcula sp. S3CR25-11]